MGSIEIDNGKQSSIYYVYTEENAMKKLAKVFALGNSNGIRFTKEMMTALDLKANDEIEYEILDDQSIIIRKATFSKEKTFDDFFKDYNGKYQCEEFDLGMPVGRELI